MPQMTLGYESVPAQPRIVETHKIRQPVSQKIPGPLRKSVESLRRIVVPVILREVGDGEYEIIGGKKRVLLAIEYGIEMIPAVVFAKGSDVPDFLGEILNETHYGNRHDTAEAVYRLYLDEEREPAEIAKILGIEKRKAEQYVREISAHPELVSVYLSGRLSHTILKMLSRRPQDEQVMAASLLEAKGNLNQDDLASIRRAAAAERSKRSPSMFVLPELSAPYVQKAQSCGDGVVVTVTHDGLEREVRIPIEKILEYA